MTSSPSDQLTVIFDGTCDFCTATRRRIERYDRHHRLHWIPCQGMPANAAAAQLCERTMVTITPEGTVDTGAQGFGRILTVLTGSPWPIRIVSLPLVCPVLSLGYGGVARVRSRLPGVTPWCEQCPEDCQPPT